MKKLLLKPTGVVKWYKGVCDDFINTFFLVNIDKIVFLLVNWWDCHNDPEAMKLALPSKNMVVMLILERTKKNQNLDISLFHLHKLYVRRIEYYVNICLHD